MEFVKKEVIAMRLLHTSDWHLGKLLEGCSRLEEQELFLLDLVNIAEENEVDMVLVAGDIYDTYNPPAQAEKLFFATIKELSKGGERPIIIIAGNHDSPQRLMASYPLATEHGILILGEPRSAVEGGRLGRFPIAHGGVGSIELEIRGEGIVLLLLPYPSEQRLNEVLSITGEERDLQQKYSKKIGEIFSQLERRYREDTINLAVSHLFVLGGESSPSERPIHVGGGLTVNSGDLPLRSQYTALGHLHRSQVASKSKNAYYAGSPLQYSKSERNHKKSVQLVDVKAGSPPTIQEVLLKNRKPIEVWEVEGMDEARRRCKESQDRKVWAYLYIETNEPLLQSEFKELKDLKEDLLSIIPVLPGDSSLDEREDIQAEEKDMVTLFTEYYQKDKGVSPSDAIIQMFHSIIQGGRDQ